jgi:hypothetical protein
LKVNIENNSDVEENPSLIFKLIDNKLNEWKNIRKKQYPLSLKWYPEIYREMFCFYKYGIIPEERFNNTTNPRVYINRFRELAKKSFYFSNERLYFNYLKNEGIKHIYSRPHHPQTNGCLERFHRELHKHMKNYLDNYKDFNDSNIENSLDDYILYHNNTIKSSTRYTPNEIRDLTDKNLIEIIINNMIKSFKKHAIDINEILDRDEKLLLWNKLILKNEIYIKNTQEKKGEFLYPCIFQNYINTETIKISFEIDINNQFKKDTKHFL